MMFLLVGEDFFQEPFFGKKFSRWMMKRSSNGTMLFILFDLGALSSALHVLEAGKQLASDLVTEGVNAVALQGYGKGLLTSLPDGRVKVQQAPWLERLLRQGAVPVLAPVLKAEEGIVRCSLSDVLEGFVQNWSEHMHISVTWIRGSMDHEQHQIFEQWLEAERLQGIPVYREKLTGP